MMKYALSRFTKNKKNLAQDPLAIANPGFGVEQLEECCSFIPLHQIIKATNDFDDAAFLGVGGYGKVYRGNLDDGATTTVVAIKRLKAGSKQGLREFWAEVRVLSKFRHTNLISLVGYCNENREMILVYEYMAEGNLADYLYKTSREGRRGSRSRLTWEQRLRICHGAALGLDYLHNGGIVPILHQDVKTTNILLNEYLVAKVSDFGLSKFESFISSSSLQGTAGYLDPSFFSTYRLTRKSDVYSFGVVLLEVLCARPPIDGRLDMEQISLTNWAEMNIKKGKLGSIIDPSLNGDATPDSLDYFAELATKCLHKQSEERPTMAEVVESLENALVLHQRKGKSQDIVEGETSELVLGGWDSEAFARNTEIPIENIYMNMIVEQGGPEVINATITLDDIRRLYGRMNRKDAAAHLDISVSTFKRKCREYGIQRWPHTRKKEVRRPPRQHGEGNTSTACKMPSQILQTGMQGESVGQNQEANKFRQDFMEGPIALNTTSGLIMVRSPSDKLGERNTSTTCKTPFHNLQTGEKSTSTACEAPLHNLETEAEVEPVGENQEANAFRRDFTEGPFAWDTENCFITGVVQTPPFHDSCLGNYPINYKEHENTGSSSEWASQVIDLSTLFAPHPNQDALIFPETQIDWRNSLASQAESFPDIHTGSSTLTFPTFSNQAAPSHIVQVQSMKSTVYPDDNALVFPHTEIVSLQEPFPEGHVFDPISRNKHTNVVTIKAFYGDTVLKFLFPLASGIVELKNKVSKRLNVAVDRFEVKYKDKYEHLVSIPCNEDWMLYLLSSLENEEIRVFVFDKVGGSPILAKAADHRC